MRRLGAVLFLVFLMGLYADARSVWSGGVKWGDGSPSASDRTDGYWLPDAAASGSGRPMPDIAIGAHLYTDQLMAASWELGIPDYLAPLSPSTASLSFKGQVTGTPGDSVVITTGIGTQWVGRLDTLTDTRDVNGDHWTTVTATDNVGALGAALVDDYDPTDGTTMEEQVEAMAAAYGVPLDVVDDSASGLVNLDWFPSDGFTGSVLEYINKAAATSNAMVALHRDGDLHAVVREAVTPSSVLTLSGINAPESWSELTSIDVDINQWLESDGGTLINHTADLADIDAYGLRSYSQDRDVDVTVLEPDPMADWAALGGSQRPTVTADLIVSSYTQDDLILLDPFQWVTEDGDDWQVLSVRHNVTASPYEWKVSITADNLLDLL